MAQYGNGYGVGLRFENITIPKDAAITNAYIQFVPGRTDSDPIQVKIYGQASDNPATFMTGVLELLNRTRTTTYVEWDIPPWTGITIESKIDVAKSVIGELVKDTSISWGFGSWCNETPWSTLVEDPKTYTIVHEGCKPHTVVVGSPPFFHQFSNYKSFVIDKVITNPRDSLIYVGSNDGMLHVFNLASGVEEWAFLPKGLQDKLNHATENDTSDMCSVNYCHQYMLDGSPMAADVYVNVDNQMQWRTMLVIGQRGGGSTYTALDVTSGQSLDPSNDDPARYLWEYSHASLGETWSDPSIVRVRDATGDVNTDTAWGCTSVPVTPRMKTTRPRRRHGYTL